MMPPKNNKMKYTLWFIPVAVVACLVWLLCAQHSHGETSVSDVAPEQPLVPADVSCLLKADLPEETPQIMVQYTGFEVSFNPAHRIPNYVSWELLGSEVNGQVSRDSKFIADKDVYNCAEPSDYRGSGFDRGHMAPAGDMKWSSQAMADSHYLTNICPQTHALNGGRWKSLEEKCRQWALRDSALVIVCGPVLTDRLTRTIGKGVSVPERFFKVILAPFADPPRAIGFIMPNFGHCDGLEVIAMPVDRVEQATGIDFFSCLPDSIEDRIEAHTNFRDWNRRR